MVSKELSHYSNGRKWKSHLEVDDISIIRSRCPMRIYHGMMCKSELESGDYRKSSSSLFVTAIDASRECSGGTNYLSSPHDHIRKNLDIFTLISPSEGSKVFEIGPGVGFFAYFCQNIGAKYMGIDSKLDPNGNPWGEKNSYHVMHKKLNLTDLILKQSITRESAVNFHGKHDHIVAVGAISLNMVNCDHKSFEGMLQIPISRGESVHSIQSAYNFDQSIRELYCDLSDSEKMSTTRFNQNEVYFITKDALAKL